MTITIKFYYSPSKRYDSVCEQAKSFTNFKHGSYENQIILTEEELKEKDKREILNSILNTINGWSGTTYYIDNSIVKKGKICELLNILDCEHDCASCIQEHCYSNYGWGCNFLNSIALVKNADEDYYYRNKKKWYDFGKFENEIWIIDKKSILQNLMQEATGKNLLICAYFSEERVQSIINSLPDKIEITDDGEWEYRYQDVLFGAEQKERIGVRPKIIPHKSETYTTTIDLGPDKYINKYKTDQNAEQHKKKNIPLVKFSDIGGCDDIIQQVREIIELPLIAPDLIKHYGITPHKGILLYGPPGCGKTMIAKAVANEIEAHFITVSGPEILDKFEGQSEENLRNIFTEAEENEPSIIYFDEFDSIAATRDSENAPYLAVLVNQLLTLMDGVESSNKICCIASTNRLDRIDPAIIRPGRFDYVIEVHRPSPDGCKAIFDIYTSKMPIENDFNKDLFVEHYLIGCSGAEIAFITSEAAYNSIRRTVDFSKVFKDHENYISNDQNIVTESDFVEAVKRLKQIE